MRQVINYLILSIMIISCEPSHPITPVDNKIKTLTILFNNDTAFYKFIYNTSGNIDTIYKKNNPYALFSYSSDRVIITRITSTYIDSILVYKSSTNFIDSILDGSSMKRYYRNTVSQLDSIKQTDGNINLNHHVVQMNNNDILLYNQTLPYTCGIFSNICIENSNDTILYSSYNNQTNLPEQFIGVPISEGLNFLDLNPILMLQQSGILPYQPHNHLRANWITKYSIIISQSQPNSFNLRYQYQFDAQNRVTDIYVYNTLISTTISFKEYHMTY